MSDMNFERRRGQGYLPGHSFTSPDQLPRVTAEAQLGPMISVGEVAERLGISPEDLDSLVAEGRILSIDSGGRQQVPVSYLVADHVGWRILPGLDLAIGRESTPGRTSLEVALALSRRPARGVDRGKSKIDRLHEDYARQSRQ